MKKYLFPIVLAIPLALAACGQPADDETAPSTTISTATSTTSSTVTSTSSTTTSAAPSSTAEPTPTQEPTPEAAPVEQAPAVPAEVAEPYVVECLFGTPGPSLMSDGTTIYTDYCFYENGGPEYLEQESWANSPDNPALSEYYEQLEQQPSPWVQGQIDWTNCLNAGNSEQYCRDTLN